MSNQLQPGNVAAGAGATAVIAAVSSAAIPIGIGLGIIAIGICAGLGTYAPLKKRGDRGGSVTIKSGKDGVEIRDESS